MRPLFTISRRIRWAAVLALVLAATAPVRANNSSTFHYLAVGVSRYAAGGHLNFAHQDALDLAKIWRGQEGKLHGKVVGETLIDSQATLGRILSGLDRLIQTVKAGDTAVISLSGHGGFNQIRDPNWYFLPHDFRPGDLPGTALGTAVLRTKLTALSERGATVILILDACHSGGYGGSEGNIVILASCMPNQVSREHHAWRNGAYTKALIEALQGQADTDRDGSVTLAEVDAYVANRVPQLFLQVNDGLSGGSQHPTSAKPTSVRSAMPLARVATPTGPRNPVN